MKLIGSFWLLASCSISITSLGAVTEYYFYSTQKGGQSWNLVSTWQQDGTHVQTKWKMPLRRGGIQILFFFKLFAQGVDHRLSRILTELLLSWGPFVCVFFSNWQFKRSEKDWINLNFTAARLQGALYVSLYYYLSGWKTPLCIHLPLEGWEE